MRNTTVRTHGRPRPVNLVFVLLSTLVAAVAAWPIYQSVWFVVTVSCAVLLAVLIVMVVARGQTHFWRLMGVTILSYAVIAPLVTYPTLYSDLSGFLRHWVSALASAVTAWKSLITLPIPVGHFEGVLAPAFIVFLFGTVIALWATQHLARGVLFASFVLLAELAFGIAFGFGQVTGEAHWFGSHIRGLRELALAGAMFGILMLWMLWRARDRRRRALQRSDFRQATETVAVERKQQRMSVRVSDRIAVSRLLVAGAMVVIAAVLGVFLSPAANTVSARQVLRTQIDPQIALQQQKSPLIEYRSAFSRNWDVPLFSVSSEAPLPERLRLAVLSFYDGELYRVTDPNIPSSSFIRVPYRLTSDLPGTVQEFEVTINGGSQEWVPLIGQMLEIEFLGENALQLADGFFYQEGIAAGVQLNPSGLNAGDQYRFTALVPEATLTLAHAQPLSDQSVNNPGTVPSSLQQWLKLQDVPRNGAGLDTLVQRLRERGYLSHALTETSINDNGVSQPQPWLSELPGYSFVSSLAGHSLGRIDMLFTELLEKERDQTGGNLVAAPGNDEQFSVAVALLAQELGFQARIVLGTYLQDSADSGQYRIPSCVDGVCVSQNLAAWVEVADQSGAWIPVDVTPQFEHSPGQDELSPQDPKHPSRVEADRAEQLPPEQAQPDSSTGDEAEPSEPLPEKSEFLPGVQNVLLIGLGVLALLIPFLFIGLVKMLRARRRRRARTPELRIIGAWDELLDTASELDIELPQHATRNEIAQIIQSKHAMGIARMADEAEFSPFHIEESTVRLLWRAVGADRTELRKRAGLWQGLWSRVSLRSFTRYLRRQDVPQSRQLSSFDQVEFEITFEGSAVRREVD